MLVQLSYAIGVAEPVSIFVDTYGKSHVSLSDGEIARKIKEETVKGAVGYLVAYVMVIGISLFIISFDGFDFETNFTAVMATVNNIGPGLAGVGPSKNFDSFSLLSKFVLSFDMLAGRLELYPILLLITPGTWRKK